MKIIIANWKSNPRNVKLAKALAKVTDLSSNRIKLVIAPPDTFLEDVGNILKKASLGAQDVFWADSGAYTGEVSIKQLKSLKVKYVIIGHSERRKFLKETDKLINKKIKASLKAGFKVILCIGEWQRHSLAKAKIFVKSQIRKDLDGVKNYKNLIIAYEPVWAISTNKSGKSDRPEDAVEMAKFIKQSLVISHKLPVKVLYGGSVTYKNAKSFLRQKEIDGALVGGASLIPKDFKKIVQSV